MEFKFKRKPFCKLQREQIFELIKESIIENEIPEGTILVEAKLAKEFGVSITPIKEAIRMLENEGLVQSIPYKGSIAKSPSLEEKIEIYKLRGILEAYAGSLASKKITEKELKYLGKILKEAEAYILEKKYEKVMEYNTMFHRTIWEVSRNRKLIKLLENIGDYIQSMRREAFSLPKQIEINLMEHKEILKLLTTRDSKLVEEKIRDHIFHLVEKIRAQAKNE